MKVDLARLLERRRHSLENWMKEHSVTCLDDFKRALELQDVYATPELFERVKTVIANSTTVLASEVTPVPEVLEQEVQEASSPKQTKKPAAKQ